ncbi:Dyp-type peroxidase [Corticibacter populi]|uniref:Dyp-type peroxidase n=1 Tax=Corticibacter populi TaxID=1550736 RepID=A0A3M6QX75_9BURK|nr:Dyp-type peroxidase [Corticibacter populi]RMX07584.1 Dyp-type peroxidase [Corticibacter populi]RZS30081.1 putative iron-dependent peroxidase [Corticibacter populi]
MTASSIPPLSETTVASGQPGPQPVVEQQGMAAHFIVLNIAPGAAAEETVRAFFGNAAALVRSVGRRLPELRLSMVVGIGSNAWDRLFGTPRPAHLHVFKELQGGKHRAPSTPGDLLLHIRAQTVSMCFELAMQAMRALEGAVEPVDEVHGFRYFDARSMVGFVDGTENPEGQEALEATLIGTEDPDFAGGSYVIVQKYLHDMTAWNQLPTEEQERVIGRTKHDDIELADDVKPSNSHVALNVVEDENGNELAIVRNNLPFATPSRGEYGTYFIGYARDPAVTELMLTNMFIGRPPGNYDRLLDFSVAVTGTLFFVPSQALLEALADGNPLAGDDAPDAAETAETAASTPSPVAASAAGTLQIGSLKGQPQLNRTTSSGGSAQPGSEPAP